MREPYIGEIILFAGNYPPKGWCYCDGRLLDIRYHESLFCILQDQYGGDMRNTFAVPKKKNPSIGGVYIIALEGILPKRSESN